MREEESRLSADGGRSPAEWFGLVVLVFMFTALTYALVVFAVDEVRLAVDGATRSAQVVESYPKLITARLEGTSTVVDLITWSGQPAPGSTITLRVVASQPSIGQQQGVIPWFQAAVGPVIWVVLALVLEGVWRGPQARSRALVLRVADRFGLDWFQEPSSKAATWAPVRVSPERVDGQAFRVLSADRQFDTWANPGEIYRLNGSGELTVLKSRQQQRVYGMGEWLEVQVYDG